MKFRDIRNWTLAILLAIAGLAAPASQTANATDFAPVTMEQMIDASTYIVRGTVKKVWTEQDSNGRVWTRARVAVTDNFKGTAPAEIIVDNMGGTFGDVRASVWATARYSLNEDVFIFVEQLDNGRLSSFGLFNGKFTIRRAAGDTKLHAMKWHGHPDEPFDHRFLPYPAPQDRLYLDSLVERVQNRVTAGWDGQPVPGVSMETLRKINVKNNGGLQ